MATNEQHPLWCSSPRTRMSLWSASTSTRQRHDTVPPWAYPLERSGSTKFCEPPCHYKTSKPTAPVVPTRPYNCKQRKRLLWQPLSFGVACDQTRKGTHCTRTKDNCGRATSERSSNRSNKSRAPPAGPWAPDRTHRRSLGKCATRGKESTTSLRGKK